jgi:VanZ family protein
MGAAFAVGYDWHRGRLSTMLIAFAAAVELAQLFAPSRHARLGDFIVDALAACVGAMCIWLIKWMLERR